MLYNLKLCSDSYRNTGFLLFLVKCVSLTDGMSDRLFEAMITLNYCYFTLKSKVKINKLTFSYPKDSSDEFGYKEKTGAYAFLSNTFFAQKFYMTLVGALPFNLSSLMFALLIMSFHFMIKRY